MLEIDPRIWATIGKHLAKRKLDPKAAQKHRRSFFRECLFELFRCGGSQFKNAADKVKLIALIGAVCMIANWVIMRGVEKIAMTVNKNGLHKNKPNRLFSCQHFRAKEYPCAVFLGNQSSFCFQLNPSPGKIAD